MSNNIFFNLIKKIERRVFFMIDLKIEVNPSFYKKINHDTIKEATATTIKNTTLKAESECKKEAPYDTGALRRGHSSEISDEEGLVINGQGYWVYVVFGTYKMDANNYPQRVVNSLASEQFMSRTLVSELKKKGVIE